MRVMSRSLSRQVKPEMIWGVGHGVCPSGDSVEIAQNRIQEKAWIAKAGLETAPYLPVTQEADLTDEAVEPLLPGIVKTAMLGYDGKGQIRVSSPEGREIGRASCRERV